MTLKKNEFVLFHEKRVATFDEDGVLVRLRDASDEDCAEYAARIREPPTEAKR